MVIGMAKVVSVSVYDCAQSTLARRIAVTPPSVSFVTLRTVNTRTPESRQERKQRTRQDLLQAALRLLEDQSFSGLSLREVTREAGVVPTAFYRHFDNMEELGLALIDESFRTLREMIRAARADPSTYEHVIRQLGRDPRPPRPREPAALHASSPASASAVSPPYATPSEPRSGCSRATWPPTSSASPT